MARKLKNISVDFISLVQKGANGKTVILKSANEKKPDFEKELVIKAVNGTVYGVVYSPDEVDSQGDFTDAGEIRKAAYAFMKSLGALNVDANHDGQKRPAFVAESWLIRKGDPVFPDEKEGAWAVGIQLEDSGLIAAVQKGEITGLSMAGYAETETVEKQSESAIMKMFRDLLEKFEPKKTGGNVEKADFTAVLKEVSAVAEKLETAIDGMRAENAELKKQVEGIETRLAKSGQNTEPGKATEIAGIM